LRALLPVLVSAITPFFILTLIVVSVGFGLVAWRPPTMWVATIAAPSMGSGITALANGSDGLYASGVVGPYGASPGYLFIAKYDAGGGQIWSKTFGIAFASIVNAISAAQDGLYITGESGPSPSVLKYDLNGNQIWNDSFGGFGGRPTSLYATSNGIYVGGYIPEGGLGNSTFGGFLRHYDSNGNLVWTKLLENSTTGPLFLYVNSDGVFVSGSNSEASSGARSAFVRKYDTQNNLAWNQTFICDCASTGMSGDSTGVYTVGQARGPLPGQVWSGSTDTFIRKYDFNGNSIWTMQFGPPDYTTSISPQISAVQSGVYLTVDTGGPNGFLMKYDSNGVQEWSVQIQKLVARIELASFSTVLSAGSAAVYIGSSYHDGNLFVAAISVVSSLVIFGINPPASFLVIGSLVTAAVVSVLLFRRERRSASRSGSLTVKRRAGNLPTDALTPRRTVLE